MEIVFRSLKSRGAVDAGLGRGGKIVEFPLTAGVHVLEIAANAEPTTDVLIVQRSESDFRNSESALRSRLIFR